jgi:predicted phage gp36 major capsid-like protein
MHPNSISPTIEVKTTGGDHISDINQAFAAFRETNDERMAQIERRMAGDVVTEEKLARIDRALDETKRRLDNSIMRRATMIRCYGNTRVRSAITSAAATALA